MSMFNKGRKQNIVMLLAVATLIFLLFKMNSTKSGYAVTNGEYSAFGAAPAAGPTAAPASISSGCGMDKGTGLASSLLPLSTSALVCLFGTAGAGVRARSPDPDITSAIPIVCGVVVGSCDSTGVNVLSLMLTTHGIVSPSSAPVCHVRRSVLKARNTERLLA